MHQVHDWFRTSVLHYSHEYFRAIPRHPKKSLAWLKLILEIELEQPKNFYALNAYKGKSMSTRDLDMVEQTISKATEVAVRSQLDEVEDLQVEIHTDAVRLAGGQVDKLTVSGSGLVVKNDLRTDSLDLEARSIDVNMLKAALGEIELEQPAKASTKVVLKAEDIQKAFNSNYVKKKLRGQKIDLPSGDRVTTDASNVEFTIPEAGKIVVAADVMLIENVEKHHVSFSAKPKLVDGGNAMSLEEIEYDEATNDMPGLTRSLIDSTQDLLDLRNFEIGEMSLQFDSVDVQPGKIIIQARATITSL